MARLPTRGPVSIATVIALICAGPAVTVCVAIVAVVGGRLCLW